MLDATSFGGARDTLLAESRGVSMLIKDHTEAMTYIESVLKHVDATLRYGGDGALELALNRADVALGDMPVIAIDDLAGDPARRRPDWIETYNKLSVAYTHIRFVDDAYGWKERTTDASWMGFDDLPAGVRALMAIEDGYGYWDVGQQAWIPELPESMYFCNLFGAGTWWVDYYDPWGDCVYYAPDEGAWNDHTQPTHVRIWFDEVPANCHAELHVRFDPEERPTVGYNLIYDGTLYYSGYPITENDNGAPLLLNPYNYTKPEFEVFTPGSISHLHVRANEPFKILRIDFYTPGGAVKIKESNLPTEDVGHQKMIRRVRKKDMRLMMFTNPDNAFWAAERTLKAVSYPLTAWDLPLKRAPFAIQPGDLFRVQLPEYGVADMVCRAGGVREDGPDSERIHLSALEDIDYVTGAMGVLSVSVPQSSVPAVGVNIDVLDHVDVVEAFYAYSGQVVGIIPLAGRETRKETGYQLWMSIDGGSSYTQIAVVENFNVYGTLVGEYSEMTSQIDDGVGFQVDFANGDVYWIDTISRAELLGNRNLAMLGGELISFDTITPVSGNRYQITGIYRGRYDTRLEKHSAGDDFWFLGSSPTVVVHENILVGVTRRFKLVPFYGSRVESLVDAEAVSLSITGRSFKPYEPSNLAANGQCINPTYSGDIVLTWLPRLRGAGAGIGDADSVTDDAPSWEGTFTVAVWVSGSLVRTAAVIDAMTWTYTSAMNISDNGALAASVLVKLVNTITTGGSTYSSPAAELNVNKE